MQRLIPILVGVGSVVALLLAFTHQSEAYSVVIFLIGLVLFLRNLFPVIRPKQDSLVSSRLASGIGLLLMCYATFIYLSNKRAISETGLGVTALVGTVGLGFALRYLWRASRAMRAGSSRSL